MTTDHPIKKLHRPQVRPLRPQAAQAAAAAAPMQFATTITTRFVPGLLALLESMLANAGIAFEFSVVQYQPDPKWDTAISDHDKERIEAMGVPITWYVPDDLGGEFPFDRSLTDSDRMAANIDKPLVWNLPIAGPVCYTDADVLCLASLEGIKDFPSFTVVAQGTTINQEDPNFDGRYWPSPIFPFNAGFFVFEPSTEIYQELVEHASTYTEPISFGDQAVLNNFMGKEHPDEVNYVDMSWNTCTWVTQSFADLLPLSSVKLLHFAGPKPWADPIEHEYQKKPWAAWNKYHDGALVRIGESEPLVIDHADRFAESNFRYRNLLGLYLNRLGLTGIGAEVGVYEGSFTKKIWGHWHGEHLFAIDKAFKKKPDLPNTTYIEGDSQASASWFKDGSLDFVYIDACHTYEMALWDIMAYMPKLVPGGLLCGHDYYMSWTPDVAGNHPAHEKTWGSDYRDMPFGVKQAVTDVCEWYGLHVEITAEDEIGSPSWFIRMPGGNEVE